ncbi:hypothetical protein HYH03_018432 [Edaphochlamys debaryana]|uniref:Uncharacterized protein n=1 Tax=Edaphochlamys debaryana TaxID=47281 RepID=A0A835XM03_9CHLO|nr:hypothetical protein HYH03_018432 [Edaphochlamys debaryana]|eukprot:KAG2482659.1 hypothetical protein HYH03_018432 [Edaphochlamys debaryana]
MLVELSERRGALLQKLNVLIEQRQGYVEWEVRRQQLAAEAEAARTRVAQAESALQAARREATGLRAANAARRSAHERAAAELAGRRSEHLAHHPTLLRYQALTASHVSAMLLAEQRAKLSVLLEALPLRVSAIRQPAAMLAAGGGGGGGPGGSGSGAAGGGGGNSGAAAGGPTGGSGSGSSQGGGGASPMQVTICNLKLPDAASVSSLMAQQPEATSSALGYLLLLVELLATYCGGPVLHEGSFQGSTSVVWQQHSFWNRRPSSSNARLPLFMEEGGGGPAAVVGAALSNPFPGLAAKVRGPTSWGSGGLLSPGASPGPAQSGAAAAFSALTRAVSATPASGALGAGVGYGSGDRHLDEALVRQRQSDLRLAYDMLLRSVACFARDKVNSLGLQLPPGWGPLGWLVVLCATLRPDPATTAVLAAAQAAVLAAPGSGDLRVGAGPGDGDGGGGPEHDDEAEEVEEDGWDVVQAPFLPPPPSQPDEVEHWTRAMFTDASSSLRGGPAPATRRGPLAGLSQGLPGPPAMSLERVRSIFSK